ncbi:hypothetical protein DFH08DRAFT_820907 [Mycena albidolilacea]|uniref:DhaL domain-containing protein n=1 Tax=Mycena albidolilacea TaxID=1033008 RepID=A0AAD6ZB67_9AGAR|nr:hypothetical protein DFH08DRAFT_820907 [Mycena albidolilacea]
MWKHTNVLRPSLNRACGYMHYVEFEAAQHGLSAYPSASRRRLRRVRTIAKVAKMARGGTSGALYLYSSPPLPQGTQSASTTTTTPNLWASILSAVLATLYPYTCACPLSCTLVDPLTTFVDSFSAKAKGDPGHSRSSIRRTRVCKSSSSTG